MEESLFKVLAILSQLGEMASGRARNCKLLVDGGDLRPIFMIKCCVKMGYKLRRSIVFVVVY